MMSQTTEWLDERLGVAKGGRKLLNKIFPDHWSFMLGEIALYSFIVLLFTGVFLTLFFVPSSRDVIYHGSYAPLRGQTVSEAYASTVRLSFDVRAGLVMRQMHHWAANVFIAAIVVHMLRIFFTGAFRKPREMNWVVGVTLMILAIVNGFLGYSLPDDLISGTGIRIAFSIVLSVPVVGTYLAFLLFGGNFPGNSIIPRFYTIHVLIVPGIIIGLLAAHLGMMVRQKHTQYPAKGRTNKNVVGIPAWPAYAFQAGGFFFLTAGVLAALGGLVQINPIWLYGQYVPYRVSYAVQPDWYMGWLDGALRLMPSWETVLFGRLMIPNVFFPAVLLPGVTFTVLAMWPFIERKWTKDDSMHNILERPRDNPLRTALGASVLSFYVVLFFASSTDVLANTFNTSLNIVLWSFRILLFVVPPIVWFFTYQFCKETSDVYNAGKRKHALIISRSASGEYSTVESEAYVEPEEEEIEEIPQEVAFHNGESQLPQEDHHLVGASSHSSANMMSSPTEDMGPLRSGGTGIFKIPRNIPGGGATGLSSRKRRPGRAKE